MNIIGLNLGSNIYGKLLNDGGVCLIQDGTLRSIVIEERVSRAKRAGGYEKALQLILRCHNIDSNDLDMIAISSCCELEPNKNRITSFNNLIETISVNHHISHACSVYSLCPFDESLVVVMDAGGNNIENMSDKWWKHYREQQSYYIVGNSNIDLIGRDFADPYSAGYGEVFRAFTYFLGWKSSQHAGKTMALSAYGNPNRFAGMPIFINHNDGSIASVIKNNPTEPIEMVLDLLSLYGINNIAPRNPTDNIEDVHKDLASWIQYEVEKSLLLKIDHLIKKTNINKVCLSGGVAYNCKLNGKIANLVGKENLFVASGSGDHGQCLGNASYAIYLKTSKLPKFNTQPYLGISHHVNNLADYIHKYPELTIMNCVDCTEKAAFLLSEGHILCRFMGRSEFGPRALGNRSILADPRNHRNKFRLNNIKGRDNFMPFAPSVLEEYVDDFFETASSVNYMTTAVNTVYEIRKLIPSVIHKDGSSRIHIVSHDDNDEYHSLINSFYKKTGIPMLLNTSFNKGGEPIVESIDDAFSSFCDLDINYMLINNTLIEKHNKTTLRSTIKEICEFSSHLNMNNMHLLRSHLLDTFSDICFFERSKFNLYTVFVDWLNYGRKTTTIRYKKNGIDIPSSHVLPMFSTDDFSMDVVSDKQVGNAEILKIVVKQFTCLDENDANNDGFASLDELKNTLTEIYGFIPDHDYVTIYHIYLNT